MKILLTPDQEATLWHLTQKVLTPKGESYYCFPYALKIEPDGMFERIPLNCLPDEVKDQLYLNQGLKLTASEEILNDWVMGNTNAVWVTDYMYYFEYNGVPCAGFVTRHPSGLTLQIRPRNAHESIGLGAGVSEIKHFKR